MISPLAATCSSLSLSLPLPRSGGNGRVRVRVRVRLGCSDRVLLPLRSAPQLQLQTTSTDTFLRTQHSSTELDAKHSISMYGTGTPSLVAWCCIVTAPHHRPPKQLGLRIRQAHTPPASRANGIPPRGQLGARRAGSFATRQPPGYDMSSCRWPPEPRR